MSIRYKNTSSFALFFKNIAIEAMGSNCTEFRDDELIGFRNLFKFSPDPTYLWKKINDSLILVDFNEVSYKITKGKIENLVGIKASDIFKEKKEVLKDMERSVKEKSIQDGICIIDKNYSILKANSTMRKWFPNIIPLEGKKCYQIYQKRNNPCNDCDCNKIYEDLKPVYKLIKIKTKVKGIRALEFHIFPFFDQIPRKVKGVIEYVRDVTEKLAAEEALKRSELKYRSILENMKEGYFEMDLDGNLTFCNEALCNILKFSKKELTNKNCLEIINKNSSENVCYIFDEIINTEIPKNNIEFELTTKEGERIFIISSVYLRFNSNGEKCGISGLVRDITEKKKAEILIKKEIQKLKEIDKIKNRFISRASHELKTPLVLINNTFQLIDLYNYKFNKESLLLLNIIKKGECIDDLKPLADIRNIKIISILGNLIPLKIDKNKIRQVIINILSNAIKNTPPFGIIYVFIEEGTKFINIKIKDTGVGFTQEEKTKIFKKFGKIERYGNGMNIDTDGSGMGLYISHKFVTAHEGKLLVESKGRNKGSTFIIKLPI
ncbi:MAG: PAS domain S-box protein [Candidatus Lokiarchaeota archaeon]